MHSVEHTLTVVAEKLGLTTLQLNDAGQAELVLGEALTAYITRLDAMAMELSFRLPRISYSRPSMMRAMLVANHLGTLTGPGRLAIDPGNEEAVYSERWDVGAMNVDDVERRLKAFIRSGAYWLTQGSDDLIAEGDADLLGLGALFGETSEDEALEPRAPVGLDAAAGEDAVMFRL